MGKANTFGPGSGLGSRANAFFDSVFVDFDDPDQEPIVSDVMPLEHYDGAGVQLISGGARAIEVLDGDEVVESTSTWTFKAGNFTASDVGATFTVTGSSEGNDGDYVIDSVTNAFTVVSVDAPNDDETFDPDAVTVDLVQSSPEGNWDFRVSNSYDANTAAPDVDNGSPWTPIGDQFSPAIAAVSEQYVKDTANSANQYCNAAPLLASAAQIRFTPTAGAGPVSAFIQLKGNR